jgi:nucleoid-associated protein YgaU
MAIFDFIRNAGRKLRGKTETSGSKSGSGKQQQQSGGATPQQQSTGSGSPTSSSSAPQARAGNEGASAVTGDAIRDNIMAQDEIDAPDDLVVVFDAPAGAVILEGTVPDDETAELIVLVAGNVEGVERVDDRLKRERESGPTSDFHTVKQGETLGSIAKEHYGDEKQASRISDANRVIMEKPSDMTSGMTLRVPRDAS